MSTAVNQPKGDLHQRAFEKSHDGDDPHVEILANPELMNDAFDGENREHEMGVWEAAKSHPWACFWAFIFCFTIVCLLSFHTSSQLTILV